MTIPENSFKTLVAPLKFGTLSLHTDIGYRWCWAFTTPDKKPQWGYHCDRSRAAQDARKAMKQMGINASFELVKLRQA